MAAIATGLRKWVGGAGYSVGSLMCLVGLLWCFYLSVANWQLSDLALLLSQPLECVGALALAIGGVLVISFTNPAPEKA